MNLLLSWLGQTDLTAASGDDSNGIGPVAQAVTRREFDRVELLCNYDSRTYRHYAKWLSELSGHKVHITSVKLQDPTDYALIYEVVTEKLKEIKKEHPNVKLTFHLSPGTPAMSSVWLLLSKTIFSAELIKTSRETGLDTVEIPFDISIEYVPDLIEKASNKLREFGTDVDYFGDALYRSKQMKEAVSFSRRAALFNVPVLIEGESGTGKEVFAKGIHKSSEHGAGPFIAVNCGAIPEQLVESELFGHKKGAFTGAVTDQDGHFVKAEGGTIFLDEVGELPLSAQVKLLRVIQERVVVPLGSSTPKKINVRIISATNRNLLNEVAEERFREDLFYRLAVLVVRLPPLREREGDIGLLIDAFLESFNNINDGKIWEGTKTLSPGARKLLLSHTWPGNVRELEHVIKRAVVMSNEARITEKDIENAIFQIPKKPENLYEFPLGDGFDIQTLLSKVTKHYLERAMSESGNNKSEAARLLGLRNYQTLSNWLNKYEVRGS